MKTLIYICLACVLIILLSPLAIAQPGLPASPMQAPVDGGLSLLAAAGGSYAIKKLRDRSKEQKAENSNIKM